MNQKEYKEIADKLKRLNIYLQSVESRLKQYVSQSSGAMLDAFRKAIESSRTGEKMNTIIIILAVIAVLVIFNILSLFWLAK